jgi:D-proline reductase (dithiol) PrdB
MNAASNDLPGFAPDDDAPIPYVARTREYYAAIGYTTPYRWAHYVEAPFQPLRKPLAFDAQKEIAPGLPESAA